MASSVAALRRGHRPGQRGGGLPQRSRIPSKPPFDRNRSRAAPAAWDKNTLQVASWRALIPAKSRGLICYTIALDVAADGGRAIPVRNDVSCSRDWFCRGAKAREYPVARARDPAEDRNATGGELRCSSEGSVHWPRAFHDNRAARAIGFAAAFLEEPTNGLPGDSGSPAGRLFASEKSAGGLRQAHRAAPGGGDEDHGASANQQSGRARRASSGPAPRPLRWHRHPAQDQPGRASVAAVTAAATVPRLASSPAIAEPRFFFFGSFPSEARRRAGRPFGAGTPAEPIEIGKRARARNSRAWGCCRRICQAFGCSRPDGKRRGPGHGRGQPSIQHGPHLPARPRGGPQAVFAQAQGGPASPAPDHDRSARRPAVSGDGRIVVRRVPEKRGAFKEPRTKHVGAFLAPQHTKSPRGSSPDLESLRAARCGVAFLPHAPRSNGGEGVGMGPGGGEFWPGFLLAFAHCPTASGFALRGQ